MDGIFVELKVQQGHGCLFSIGMDSYTLAKSGDVRQGMVEIPSDLIHKEGGACSLSLPGLGRGLEGGFLLALTSRPVCLHSGAKSLVFCFSFSPTQP